MTTKPNKADQKQLVRGGLGGWVACDKTTKTIRVDKRGNLTAMVQVKILASAVARWREQYPEQQSGKRGKQPTEAA
jgi:hypothetical protein